MEEFDQLLAQINNTDNNPTEDLTDCCDNPDIRNDNGTDVCISCGQVQAYTFISFEYCPQKQLYKRKSYFREKYKLLTGVKLSNSPQYQPLIDSLRKDKMVLNIINNISKLDYNGRSKYFVKHNIVRRIRNLIKNRSSRFYKHVYNIIYDLFDFKCFNIQSRYLDILTTEFINFEIAYRKVFKTKRNLFSYNIIIKLLLHKHNIGNIDLLVLPKNENYVYSRLRELNYFNL